MHVGVLGDEASCYNRNAARRRHNQTADGDSESPYPETQPDDEGRAGMGVPRLQ